MADIEQTNATSLEDWDEIVRNLLSGNELRGQNQMRAAYSDAVDRSGFSSEVQNVLKAMGVTVVRQESDQTTMAEAGAASEDSTEPFWQRAQQATTQSLQSFLLSSGVPDDVASLYSVAEIGMRFRGSPRSCSKVCSRGDVQPCCC